MERYLGFIQCWPKTTLCAALAALRYGVQSQSHCHGVGVAWRAMNERLKLPIGLEALREIRKEGYCYVDKTLSSPAWWKAANPISSPGRGALARACSSIPSPALLKGDASCSRLLSCRSLGLAKVSAFDVDRTRAEAMRWQTGYLTISERIKTPVLQAYTLRLSNREVRSALHQLLLDAWLPNASATLRWALPLYDWLAQGDAAALRAHFERLFAAIAHDGSRNDPIAQDEGYYASVFYSHPAALGFDLIAEDVSNRGQCDLTLRHGGKTWRIECKLIEGVEPTGKALAQLQAKNDAAKYDGAKILLGIEFSKAKAPDRRRAGGFVGSVAAKAARCDALRATMFSGGLEDLYGCVCFTAPAILDRQQTSRARLAGDFGLSDGAFRPARNVGRVWPVASTVARRRG